MSATNAAVGANETTRVLTLLSHQRELCVQLGALANQQRALITGEQPEHLLAVLGERQSVLERLGGIAAQLRPFQQRWREVREAMSPAQGQIVDRLVGEVNTMLSSILQKDEADAQLLAARKNVAAQSLSDMKQTRAAGAAYAAAGAASGNQMDWTDE